MTDEELEDLADEPEMVDIEFELEDSMVELLEELAEEMGITFDELVRQAIKELVDKEDF